MKFYDKLKELRKDKGISQNLLAKLIGYGQQTVSDWESGKKDPTAKALIALASYFNVSVDYLLGIENEDGTKIQAYNSFNYNNGNVNIGNHNKITDNKK